MIETNTSFVRLVRQQRIIEPTETINDYINYWHNQPDIKEDLSVFLGFTQYEYKMWTKYPSKLIQILDGEFIE